jgi:hypothetical protein
MYILSDFIIKHDFILKYCGPMPFLPIVIPVPAFEGTGFAGIQSYCHSRTCFRGHRLRGNPELPSFPRKRESRYIWIKALCISGFTLPACEGTSSVGIFLDSRLRGNDILKKQSNPPTSLVIQALFLLILRKNHFVFKKEHHVKKKFIYMNPVYVR